MEGEAQSYEYAITQDTHQQYTQKELLPAKTTNQGVTEV